MNNQKRHTRYRKSVYRKKRIKTVSITIICLLVILAVAFLVIGSILSGRTDKDAYRDDDRPNSQSSITKSEISVNSRFVPLALDGSTLGERLSAAISNGYSDVCFVLDTEDGYLYYQSETAALLGKQKNAASDLRTLSGIISLTSSRDLYCTGITYVSELRSSNDLVRSAAIGYHAALIAEVLRAGMNDVLVVPGEIGEERYDELIKLADEVHRLAEGKKVGIALPASAFTSENSADLIYKFSRSFDFLAVEIDENTDMSGMVFYLLSYNVRVLVPDAETAERVRTERGHNNVQIMP